MARDALSFSGSWFLDRRCQWRPRGGRCTRSHAWTAARGQQGRAQVAVGPNRGNRQESVSPRAPAGWPQRGRSPPALRPGLGSVPVAVEAPDSSPASRRPLPDDLRRLANHASSTSKVRAKKLNIRQTTAGTPANTSVAEAPIQLAMNSSRESRQYTATLSKYCC